MQRESLVLLRSAVGEKHHLYAVGLTGLAFIELEQGRLEAAERGFADAARTIAATLGDGHPDHAAVQTGLAEVALARDHFTQAVAHARNADAIASAAFPPT